MFRRGGQRDDRRRRVLTEDVVNRGRDTNASQADQQKCEGASYAPEAAIEKHLRLSDLVPRRLWGIGLVALFGGSVIGGVLALYHFMQPWQATAAAGSHVFDLVASGSLASWAASVILMTVSLTSFVVLSMRRHKLSDYNARYRVWAWMSGATLVMSAAATAPFHLVAAESLARLTGWQLPGGTATFWMAPTILALGVLAVRVLLDLRDSVIASVALVTSILAYGGALGMQFGDPTSLVNPQTVMALVGCKLAGHLMLMVSVLLFARHVLRDIQGLVVAKQPRRKEEKEEEAKGSQATTRKEKKVVAKSGDGAIHKAHNNPPAPKGISDLEAEPPAKRKKQRREEVEFVQSEWEEVDEQPARRSKKSRGRQQDRRQEYSDYDDYDSYDDEPEMGSHKMSKSQRKKLRKLKAQQRQGGL